MDTFKHEKTKYDVPIDHLDYRYVETCSDIKELEKILKILRSGSEGTFPELEGATEERIRQLNPQSRILVKDQPIFSTRDLGKEGKELASDFEQWQNEMHGFDESIKKANADSRLPPVRGTANITLGQQKTSSSSSGSTSSNKKPMPRSHKEWDKIDIDAELKKLDEDDTSSSQQSSATSGKTTTPASGRPDIEQHIDATGLTDDEKRLRAEKEKDKGNEAFRAGDYDEALVYYNRSISLISSVPTVNNRAQTYIKLEKWDAAIKDCQVVLAQDPSNLKALLRRSVAHKGKSQLKEAKKDLEFVLSKEPNNKRARSLMDEVETALEKQKVKGRRMVIEEVSDEDDSDGEEQRPEVERSSPEVETKSPEAEIKPEVVREQPKVEVETKLLNESESGSSVVDEASSVTSPASLHRKAASADADCDKRHDAHDVPTPVLQQNKAHVSVEEQTTASATAQETAAFKAPPAPLSAELNTMKEDGNQLFRTGSYAEAIHKYDVIIERLENDVQQGHNLANVYSNRAACRTKIGDCTGCVDDCSRALVLTPHALKPLMRRAMAYETLEKYRPAYVDYRHILAIDSSVEIARTGSSRCQQTLIQLDGPKWREKLPPIPTVSRADLPVTAAPTAVDPEVMKRREAEQMFEKQKQKGNELVKQGDFAAAAECYSRCVELCPDRVAAYSNRALCYLRLNKPSDVMTDCNKVLESEPKNVKALFRRGQAHKMLEAYAASKRDLDAVLSIEPKNSSARRELAVVHKYIEQEQEKKRKEERLAARGRRNVHIEEVDDDESSSSDVSKSDDDGDAAQVAHARNIINNIVQKSESAKKKQTKTKAKGTNRASNSVAAANSTASANSAATAQPAVAKSKSESNANEQKSKTSSDKSSQQGDSSRAGGDVKGSSSGGKVAAGLGVTVDSKAAKSSSQIRPTAQTGDIKASPYEFISAWNALKTSDTIEPYLSILKQVKPQELPKVISNKLDGAMLQKIVQCTDMMAAAGDTAISFEYLKYLTKVPRFQMVNMFMSNADKQEVQTVVKKLSTAIDDDALSELGKQYKL